RPGGYTRIVKLAKHRIGDGSDLCVLQLVSDEDTGPQVAGKYSRRRDKANNRMVRAAQLRKKQQSSAEPKQEAKAQETTAKETGEPVKSTEQVSSEANQAQQ